MNGAIIYAMNPKSIKMRKPRYFLIPAFAGFLLVFLVGPRVIPIIIFIAILIAFLYGLVRLSTGWLSRLVARIGYSIRWKIAVAIGLMAILFLFASLPPFFAMDYMHSQLHEIRDLTTIGQLRLVYTRLDELEAIQHGTFFSLTPPLVLAGALAALVLGLAIAWSVITPVRKMEKTMRRIASGDFSEPLQVENRDELGDLANRINQTARDLAKLHEATLAEERARALRERIVQVTLAQEEERRRISRELHDGLGPSLAAIGNRLWASQYLVRTNPEKVETELDEIAKSLKGHIQEIRELIYDLRPIALDQLGLVQALRQQVERLGTETGIRASLTAPDKVSLDPLAEITVFRVVQECLLNVQKHSSASEVEVSLQKSDVSLDVSVKDNGRGFDAKARGVNGAGEGFGLLSMRERAQLLGGSLLVQSSPGGGCLVTLQIPFNEVALGANSNSHSG